jgi:glycosyltransferase involved in cell wall biosynthesis
MSTVIRVFTDHNVGGDVVDFHATWRPHRSLATARLVASATRALLKIPPGQIAHIHLSERGSFLREGSLLALARRRELTTVATLHGASFLPFARRNPWVVSAVLRRADLVTCLDQATLEFVRRTASGIRSEVAANPVVVDDGFSPADTTDELVVFAGAIGLRKGADVLYRAWQIVAKLRPRARCLMVGPVTDFVPPATDRLELRSPVGPVELREILRRARVIALPTRAEGMPMVLSEAMSLGRPFVSTPVGAIPELAIGGGLLVPVNDEVRLADRLVELLDNPRLARRIGERGRQWCTERLSTRVVDGQFRQLYSAAARDKEMRAAL